MTRWKDVLLEDAIVLGNGKSRPLTNGIYPIYGGNGILGYGDRINYSGETIIIGRVGAYCGSTYYSEQEIWISDNALSAKNKPGNCAKFLYYFLLNMGLNQYAEGSSHPLLTHSLLYSLPITLPENETEQKAIAAVLSSLDDKIDFLHRQNATLEAMAEGLFRQWFVVEAKEQWKKHPLSAIAHFLNGLACQKYPPLNANERLPVLKIRELNNGIGQDVDWASNTVPSQYVVTSGDVIFSWSGSLMVKIWTGDSCVLNQHLFKVTSEKYQKWFYYFWCRKHLSEFIAISESKATTMGHIKRGDLDKAEVLVPTENELVKMSETMQPLLEKIIFNQTKIRTLEKLRDTLLPKLMTGEIKVV